ncbi:hypothetical protein PR003_g7272 [Phytophthora rubi]|uniref:Uncharacterized protein n=1 Tax=Phytophthora rubi TaxID=129364 RepID=A0A6A4FYK0_9STRA|nr:hypothetical protein PR001_g2952 [Phytophthora rubi]KAE9346773.1 hypothetical protein PR003_g7272 [Phytophthora rubi]
MCLPTVPQSLVVCLLISEQPDILSMALATTMNTKR